MRIVAGKYRGKKLYTPEGKDVRPTSERAREAVFNILNSRRGNDYSDIKLADIFAGTGAFGLEAISRGVAEVTFVDINTNLVQKNAKMFEKEQNKIKIIKASVLNLPVARTKFNMVYMDAPYDKGLTEVALEQLVAKNWLEEKALCIVEVKQNERFEISDDFDLIDERAYGLAKILFLVKR